VIFLELNEYNIKSVNSDKDITEREIDKDINKSDLIIALYGTVLFKDIKVAIKELEKLNFKIVYIHIFLTENNTTIGVKKK